MRRAGEGAPQRRAEPARLRPQRHRRVLSRGKANLTYRMGGVYLVLNKQNRAPALIAPPAYLLQRRDEPDTPEGVGDIFSYLSIYLSIYLYIYLYEYI